MGGLRNAYDFDFNAEGEWFAFDSDMEWDWGTPWYRPTRILHLMTGGDYGYREASGSLPPRFHDQPDHAPPLLDIGRSSPTSHPNRSASSTSSAVFHSVNGCAVARSTSPSVAKRRRSSSSPVASARAK